MAFLEEYTLLDEIGQGGYATVYKVRHNELGYIRAVRVMNVVIARGEEDKTYQRFLDECRLLLRIGNGNHPNIIHICRPLLKDQRAAVDNPLFDIILSIYQIFYQSNLWSSSYLINWQAKTLNRRYQNLHYLLRWWQPCYCQCRYSYADNPDTNHPQ